VRIDKKLGRGFKILERDARLEPPVPVTPAAPTAPPPAAAVQAEPSAPGDRIAQVPLKYIAPNPYQPRAAHDDAGIEELMGSISESGLLQPIVLRRTRAGYEIIAGHRRFEAARRLGLDAIPAIVREATDRGMLEMSLLENIQREDLDPVEKARAFERLETEFAITHADIGKRLGMNRSTVSNYIRLLELPEEILAHVSRGTLTMGHARALLAIDGSAARLATCSRILREGMSVRDIEAHASESPDNSLREGGRKKGRSKAAHLKDIERTLQDLVGHKVTVSQTSKGSGKITIKFRSTDEFNDIYERITSAFKK
jgi:ParB family chromosome partitioning protein